MQVVCPKGDPNQYGKRKVWAHRAPQGQINQLVAAAGRLAGGNSTFPVGEIRTSYFQLGATGSVYVFPTLSSDGLIVATGAQTAPTYQAWRSDLWSRVAAGATSSTVGNLGITVCAAVGHEGVHMLQQQGAGLGTGGTKEQRETEASRLDKSWRC